MVHTLLCPEQAKVFTLNSFDITEKAGNWVPKHPGDWAWTRNPLNVPPLRVTVKNDVR